MPATDIAIPFFGYQSNFSIDRKFRLIRKWKTIDVAAGDGARRREGLLDRSNTVSDVWADTTYRSKANEALMEKQGLPQRSTGKSHISNLCPGISRDPMPARPSSDPASSMSLLIRDHRRGCSSALSALIGLP